MTEEKSQQGGSSKKLAIAGLLASAAAGAVYLYGKNKKRTQQRLRGWALKVKGEVMEKMATVETLTRSQYDQFIDTAIEEYTDKKHIAESEVEKLREKLKGRWKEIVTHVENGINEIETEGVDTVKSAVSKALTGAAEELANHEDNKDVDPVELLKRAGASGVESALRDITTSVEGAQEDQESNSSPNN